MFVEGVDIMKGLLTRSLEQKQELEMIYLSGKGELSQRFIRVVGIREHHILAYCYKKREVRSFHIENILSVYPKKKFGKNMSA